MSKKRKRSQKNVVMVHTQNVPVYLKVLGTETGDSTPSVIVGFADRKYLFDCGEGLQRFCIEHKIKLKRIGKIFLTSNNIESFGGIPGMSLTIGGVHAEKMSNDSKEAATLDIAGPVGTERLIYATRKFCHINQQAVRIRVADVLPTSCGADICRDDHLIVHAVRVLSSEKSKKECVSYVCMTPSSRGKFLPKRAIELGVKPGSNFGKLTRGLEVTLENGNVVKPEDVMEPSNPGVAFAIVRVPGLDWIDSLVSDEDPSWRQCKDMSCIVHIVPTCVLRDKRYSEWVSSFGDKTQHIVINSEVCPQNFVHVSSAHAVERKFHLVPDVFPYRLFQSSDPVTKLPIPEFPQRCAPARNLLKYVLLPRSRRGIKMDDVLSSSSSSKTLPKVETLSSLLSPSSKVETSSSSNTESSSSKTASSIDNVVEFVFLGTSSAIPQKYRNVSGILLRFKNTTTRSKNMLLDTGEGTFGQIVRLCGGVDAARREIANLECIWISHLHADHHLGLVRLLNHFKGKNPVLVIGPTALQNWLDVVTQVHPEIKERYVFVDAVSMRAKNFKRTNCKHLEYAKSRLRDVRGVGVLECWREFQSYLSLQHTLHCQNYSNNHSLSM